MRENQSGAECPECGGHRTTGTVAGHDPDGHRIRQRDCRECGHRFCTVEIALDFDFFRTDVDRRERRVAKMPARRSPDSIRVSYHPNGVGATIRLEPGRSLEDHCRRGLHKLEGRNVYYAPNGQRICNECRRIGARARYHGDMALLPPAILAERRVANNERRRRERQRNKEESLSA